MSAQGVSIRGPMKAGYSTVLTKEAQQFLAELHRAFEPTRKSLLEGRLARRSELDKGKIPDFLPHTEFVRKTEWKGPSIPKDLEDRRVEITGPVDRKMIINALNSGAKVFMADFEDSSAPLWDVMMEGQINLRDAVAKTISFSGGGGKVYKLNDGKSLATLMVRPRGWHLNEDHFTVDGQSMSASLFDFGLYIFHNGSQLVKNGTGPYFYLPKCESHLEARLWNSVFVSAQAKLGIPKGTIRATVLIETILAAFEMDEIIYELRDHSAGLNCGRWDYIFSFIKCFKEQKWATLPDRDLVTMTAPWMANYVRLLIQTCHRRGVHAMGGMAAQIPVKDNKAANDAAFAKVKQDKLREVKAACDGTWVAHPGLIEVAMSVFNEHMPTPNQINRIPDQTPVKASDLLDLGPKGVITEKGMRENISVGLSYLEAWLAGNGCVPLHNKMEDAATAEISRCQLWQWIKHGAIMENGQVITKELVARMIDEEVKSLKQSLSEETYKKRKFTVAVPLWQKMILSDKLDDFLTSAAYPYVCTFVPRSSL